MKYLVYSITALVISTSLFAVDNYANQDSRDKLQKHDIQKAQEVYEENIDLNQNNQEETQIKTTTNSLPDLELLRTELKDKEMINNHSQGNTRDCNEFYYSDGFCDEANNEEECTWDGGDCCPGDCVDGPYFSCETFGGTCDTCLNPNSADNAEDGECFDDGTDGGADDGGADDGGADDGGADDGGADDGGDDGGQGECEDGYVEDCDGSGECCSAGWIGDGLGDCEDQAWGCDLTCYDNDGGDCLDCGDYSQVTCWDGSCADFEDECPEADCENIDTWDQCGQYVLLYGYTCQYTESFGYDCSAVEDCGLCPWVCEDDGLVTCWDNSCAETYEDCPEAGCAESGGIDSYISDGYCDSVNNNMNCNWDGGDCCGSTCLNSTYDCGSDATWAACNSECLDPEGSDDCCIEGDCPFSCEGNDLVTCWDNSCAETEADCPEITCADTDCGYIVTSGFYDYTCPEVEQLYGYDCSVCEAEGACPITCEDQGLVTCFSGECAASEDDCNGCENPFEGLEGSNYSEGYDEFYSFTATDGGFITLSTAGAGVDTKLYLYPADCDVATTFDDFDSPYIAYNDDWGSSQYGTCPDCSYSLESYIYVGIPAGDYIIVSSDTYNSAHNPFEWTLAFEVGIEGCTNETADNYDPEANIDDGTCQFADGVYFITCDGGSYQNEVSWDLINEDTSELILSGGAPFEGAVGLEPGRYYISALDSWGDGWNGNILTIVDSESNEVLSYTIEDGSEGISESFTVESTGCSLLGDVNGDGSINVVDVVSVVNGILGQGDLESIMFCGDFNQDGTLNVIDVVGIVNVILGD